MRLDVPKDYFKAIIGKQESTKIRNQWIELFSRNKAPFLNEKVTMLLATAFWHLSLVARKLKSTSGIWGTGEQRKHVLLSRLPARYSPSS